MPASSPATGLAIPAPPRYVSADESAERVAMHRAVRVAVVLSVLALTRHALAEGDGAVPGRARRLAAPAADAPEAAAPKPPVDGSPQTVCALIEAAAAANQIPVDLFTRLIWRESTFRPTAVSPKGAEGIAQFMPGTASLRQLSDPFDPQEAIPAAASYLRDLVGRFGNFGLAAAAYNAGERRVADWLAGAGGLPYETRDYVFAITGRPAEAWSKPDPDLIAGGAPPKVGPPDSCLTVAAALAKPGAGSAVCASIAQGTLGALGRAGRRQLLARPRDGELFGRGQRRFPAIVSGPPMVVRGRSAAAARRRSSRFDCRPPTRNRPRTSATAWRQPAAPASCSGTEANPSRLRHWTPRLRTARKLAVNARQSAA